MDIITVRFIAVPLPTETSTAGEEKLHINPTSHPYRHIFLSYVHAA